MPVITIADFSEIIKRQLSEENYRPIMALGRGGIGKSESMEELAHNLGIGYIDIRLLLYSETDLKGIPYPDENHRYTIWLQNKILPMADRDGDKGILVLDEITSCNKSLRTAAYQLLNERKLGEYTLPDKWLVVCLGNGEEDGGDFEGMEGNFANRCSLYRVMAETEAWKDWAVAHGVNPLVIGYINFNQADLHTFDPDNDDNVLFASPRSWKAVSDILNSDGNTMSDRLTYLRVIGNVGMQVGSRFKAFCTYKDKAIDTMDILENGVEYIPENTEIANITISSVVHAIQSDIERDVNAHVQTYSDDTMKHVANALNWFCKLKAEWAIMAIKDFRRWNTEIVTQLLLNKNTQNMAPEFSAFIHKNSAIFK